MIYITGDTHGRAGEFLGRFGDPPTADDTVIVAGDFGFIFNKNNTAGLDMLKKQPFTTAFVDGNHENFDELYKYPEERWNGGVIHRVADNIVHLTRGGLFTIEGRSFFTFGGAHSIDKAWRTENVSWWSAEMPSAEEYARGRETLSRCGFTVDYIVTHTCPESLSERVCLRPNSADLELRKFLQEVADKTSFKRWYFGHYHGDMDMGSFSLLYERALTAE
ncbi:MAG: metallophosphoesterase [Ruminococcus sp.]|nr:metallophosphoesterase [Ruminococcus sp.]